MTPLDSETAMIGCLLVQPSICCDDAFSELSEVMFSDEGCREILESARMPIWIKTALMTLQALLPR